MVRMVNRYGSRGAWIWGESECLWFWPGKGKVKVYGCA